MLHVVLSKPLDFERIKTESTADQAPGHVLLDLAEATPTTYHMPGSDLVTTHMDRLHGKLFGRPEYWALARRVLAAASPEDKAEAQVEWVRSAYSEYTE